MQMQMQMQMQQAGAPGGALPGSPEEQWHQMYSMQQHGMMRPGLPAQYYQQAGMTQVQMGDPRMQAYGECTGNLHHGLIPWDVSQRSLV